MDFFLNKAQGHQSNHVTRSSSIMRTFRWRREDLLIPLGIRLQFGKYKLTMCGMLILLCMAEIINPFQCYHMYIYIARYALGNYGQK